MTREETQAVFERMERMADELGEYAEDIVIMAVVHHEGEKGRPACRQLLDVGRGNFYARVGVTAMYFLKATLQERREEEFEEEE